METLNNNPRAAAANARDFEIQVLAAQLKKIVSQMIRYLELNAMVFWVDLADFGKASCLSR